ncbi:MAG TPA: branched-chain amino acid ABC transporter permease [Actinomycetota bacterium]
MTEFLQFLYQGLVLGSIYALIALGFVIVYKSSEVINFAHGELVLFGAYLVFTFRNEMGIPFYLALPIAMASMGVLGLAIERTILRPMVGKPVFAVVMITIGLAIAVRQIATSIWGFDPRSIDNPWGTAVHTVGGIRFTEVSVATLLTAFGLMLLFFLFFKYTKVGVAMRAAAFDQEAAMSIGVSVRRMTGLAWAIAGATATVAGMFLVAYPQFLSPDKGFVALRAFPAVILGGLDSTGGAVVGGLAIGVIEVLSQGYQPQYAPWLGNNFHVVAAYVVMVIVLMIRPYGLFGTREVERV